MTYSAVEQMARAMCRADGEDPDHVKAISALRVLAGSGFDDWGKYVSHAIAALSALEVPTEAMVEAGARALARIAGYDPDEDPNYVSEQVITDLAYPAGARLWWRYRREAEAAWIAMLRAALSENEEGK